MPETQLKHPDGYIVYAPMKISAQPSNIILQQKIDSGKYLASEKKDGGWYQLQKLDNGEIHLYSRTTSKKDNFYVDKIDNVPHIKQWAEDFLPDGTTLIGEIYVPGGKSNNMTSIMGCLPQTACQRQYDTEKYGGPVHYYVHDIIKYNHKELLDAPLYMRITYYLNYMLWDCFKESAQESYIELATYYQNSDPDEMEFYYKDFNEYINEIFAAGGEGVVFKDKDGLYEPGKRPQTNFKVKEHKDNIDLVVMKCLDPEKEYTGKDKENWPYWKDGVAITKPYYYGWKNAVVVGAYLDDDFLVEVGRVASGFTDEDRANMGANPQDYEGQVIECACMSVDKDNLSLRHPVFIRWHQDKDAKECLLKDIFGE